MSYLPQPEPDDNPTMSDDATNLEAAFLEAWPADQWRDLHVVLGVSGGADSVAMLRAAVAAKQRAGGAGRIYVAHLNHGIRPVEAAEDAAWVEQLSQTLGVPWEVGAADVPALAENRGDGLEAAARDARHTFFRQTAERLGARFVAVAHTADDQAETLLHRIVRGTGLAGLAGMPVVRQLSPTTMLVRPLLGVRRREILRYLTEIGQDYRVDATNADRRFTRNRLRNELLPQLRSDFNSDVDSALVRLAQQASETNQFITAVAEQLVERAIVISAGQLRIDCQQLAVQPPLLVREACRLAWSAVGWPLQNMGFDQWQQLHSLIASTATFGSLNLPHGIRAERRGDSVEITNPT